MSADLRDVLHTPYGIGGRIVGVELDCAGVVCEIARRQGRPQPEATAEAILAAWRRGEIESHTGFPPGWVSVDPLGVLLDGDVLLFFEPHAWCGIIDRGQFWSSSAEQGGTFNMPAHRLQRTPAEVWRFDP